MASGGRELVARGREMVASGGEIAERDEKMAATATGAADAVQPLSLRRCSTQHNPRIAGKRWLIKYIDTKIRIYLEKDFAAGV